MNLMLVARLGNFISPTTSVVRKMGARQMALHDRADEFDSTIVSLTSNKSISVCRSKRMARLRENTFFLINVVSY